jgi:hypothetical protein
MSLTDKQKLALTWSNKKAKIFSKNVKLNIAEKLIELNYSPKDLDLLQDYIQNKVNVLIHLKLENVIDFFLRDEYYKNGFEINTLAENWIKSRTGWENNLFNNIYNNAEPKERVKYGALDLFNNPNGIFCCIKFYGDSYFTLKRNTHDRITFVVGDSCLKEVHMATFKHCNIIFNLMPIKLLEEILYKIKNNKNYELYKSNYRSYIEAQIHGLLSLKTDIESLNVPKKYIEDSKIVEKLKKFTEIYNIPVNYF